ncbi:hypothetical protein ACFYST_12770 [Kitasatospora sp. NPDC004614]|uniref:hypothetical protein n=1 Tax=unclassified Kitasatospora TaxID=2633591 RepID=UPI0036899BD7
MNAAQDWDSSGLPRLTEEQRRELAESGFDLDRLHRLSRTKYGVAQIRSVLRCFTDACPGEQPGVVDVARVGEAWRLASSRPGAVLREQLKRRGLGHLDRGSEGSGPGGGASAVTRYRKPLLPRTPGRVVWGWALVLLLVVVQVLVGSADLGLGVVVGGIGLIVGWFGPVRRLVYGRRSAPRAVKVTYVLGALALCCATVSVGAVAVMALGTRGTAHIGYEDTGTGSHGTRYHQCYLDLPGGGFDPLRTVGPCPAPRGTVVSAYYMPGGDSLLRPVLADSLAAKRVGLWGVFTVLGLGLLGYAAAASTRGLERSVPRPRP